MCKCMLGCPDLPHQDAPECECNTAVDPTKCAPTPAQNKDLVVEYRGEFRNRCISPVKVFGCQQGLARPTPTHSQRLGGTVAKSAGLLWAGIITHINGFIHVRRSQFTGRGAPITVKPRPVDWRPAHDFDGSLWYIECRVLTVLSN
jgi:hypothetical protein